MILWQWPSYQFFFLYDICKAMNVVLSRSKLLGMKNLLIECQGGFSVSSEAEQETFGVVAQNGKDCRLSVGTLRFQGDAQATNHLLVLEKRTLTSSECHPASVLPPVSASQSPSVMFEDHVRTSSAVLFGDLSESVVEYVVSGDPITHRLLFKAKPIREFQSKSSLK